MQDETSPCEGKGASSSSRSVCRACSVPYLYRFLLINEI